MVQSTTDSLIKKLDVKLERLRRGEVERVSDLHPGQVDLIRGIYSDRFSISNPVRDKNTFKPDNPKYVLFISRRKGDL